MPQVESKSESAIAFERILGNRKLRQAAARLRPGGSVKLARVWGSAGPMLAAALGRIRNAPVLLITQHLDDADEAADDIEVLTGQPARVFPAWEVDLELMSHGERVSDEVTAERVNLCRLLSQPADERDGPADVVVAPVMALLQPVPTAKSLAGATLSLARGQPTEPEALNEWLLDAGYEHVEQVDAQGQFARRGGIVDVFAPGGVMAVRLEFFGDQIESIRRFDLDTMRSSDELPDCDFTSLSAAADLMAGEQTHLLSYLPKDTIVCMSEPAEIVQLADELHRRIAETSADGAPCLAVEPGEVFRAVEAFANAGMYIFAPQRGRADTIDMGIRTLERISLNTHEALGELAELAEVAEVSVCCENAAERERFAEVLGNSHPALARRVRLAIGHVNSGFYWPAEHIVAVGHHEVFHRYAKVRRIRRVRTGRPIDSLLDLSEGDYVVHVAHGIAKFEGLRTLEKNGSSEEYLTLRFAKNAVIHTPASRINLVQKYIGSGHRRPSLSTLGASGWLRAKQRVGEAVKDLAAEMLRIQAMRQAMEGVSYPADTDWQRRFAAEFIYTETEDQIDSFRQITQDMLAARPMDRLLCGDVGYGKTELAMRAAFKVVEAGKQVAVLVPTTVLADQHHRTFTERMADYPFTVDVISRFRTASQQASILKRLQLGQLDVLIGTHRLLSKDVRFADLGLVVVDEEQRFGVEHKEQLKRMRATVDVLTMTATPIPRTMHMSLLGLRDISSLGTPPLDRRAIHTEVVPCDDTLLRAAILRELNRQGQVFFVHNRVRDIEAIAEHVRTLVPEARVAVGHGQMSEHELEKTMLRFVRQQIDVIVCTTIIESGLDIPTANTIIIHEADRFGLAQLHQLRGRVGRYKHRAFCYLMLPRTRPVSAVAARRLKTVEEFSDLGAGFQIAMRDLEIRGAGNILGRAQSGHIATVGYELYCQLLEQSVRQLRGQPGPSRRDVHVELNIDAYIPRTYAPSERQRMEIYRRLGKCHAPADVQQLEADIADAYGPPGEALQTLLAMAEIRCRAAALGIESIISVEPDLVFTVADFAACKGLFDDAAGTVRLPDERTVHWRLPQAYRQMPTLLNVLLNRLRRTSTDL